MPSPGFHVIAHRGGAGYAPENTLAAFERSYELGVREVELDARLSRDGEIVLFHDDQLDAKTPLVGRVGEHEAADLIDADIGRWFDATHTGMDRRFSGTTLTTLPALLSRFGAALDYHIELKGMQAELPERVLATLRAEGDGCTAILTSFAFDDLVRVVECHSTARACWLLRDARYWISSLPAAKRERLVASQCERVDRAAAAGLAMVGVRASALSRELVEHTRSSGVAIRAWGVECDAALEHAIAVGAGGATIDWPQALLDRLSSRGIATASGARD